MIRQFIVYMVCGCLLCVAAVAQGTLSDGALHVHYEKGHASLAKDTLEQLEQMRERLYERLPLGEKPVDIYICARHNTFNRIAGRYGDWNVGGVAIPSENTVAVKAPAVLSNPQQYFGIARHELVHILLDRNVNTDALPKWLNEGLCMVLAREHRFDGFWTIANMYIRGQIMTYPELLAVMGSGPAELQFGNAYAQSRSMTRWLMREMGEEPFWAMVMSLEDQRFLHALDEFAGISPRTLWEQWFGSLWIYGLLTSLVTGIGLFQLAALLVLMGWARKHWRARKKLAQWEAEEEDEVLLPSEVLPDGELYDWELEGGEDQAYR